MSHQLEFHPDLADCLLEDRALMAVVVPSLPWLEVTASLSASFSGPSGGGTSLANLPPLPGPPVISIGGSGSLYNNGGGSSASITSGALFSYYGLGYGTGRAGPTVGSAIGSGANGGSGGGSGRAGTATGYGSSINSGYGTSLNALNAYGAGSALSAIGQSTSANEAPYPSQPPAQPTTDNNMNTTPSRGVADTGGMGIGVDVRGVDTLLKGGMRANPSMGVTGR